MTAIGTDDPKGGPALPEIPPAPIAVLVTGTVNLLQEAADLPHPQLVSIFDSQQISLQFAGNPSSLRAITRWALRFGSVMTSEPYQGRDGTETWCRTQFDYFGIGVNAYAHIPAATAST